MDGVFKQDGCCEPNSNHKDSSDQAACRDYQGAGAVGNFNAMSITSKDEHENAKSKCEAIYVGGQNCKFNSEKKRGKVKIDGKEKCVCDPKSFKTDDKKKAEKDQQQQQQQQTNKTS